MTVRALKDWKMVEPTARQIFRYTEGASLRPIECVVFKPGGGRGRPRKGHGKLVLTCIDDVRLLLSSPQWVRYRKVEVRFRKERRVYPARVEYDATTERAWLVTDIGIVTGSL